MGLSLNRTRTPKPVIDGTIPATGQEGVAYAGFTPRFRGRSGGTWTAADTPSGLTFSTTAGTLTGTPDAADTYAFSMYYTDRYGGVSNTLSASIVIDPA